MQTLAASLERRAASKLVLLKLFPRSADGYPPTLTAQSPLL
jgi:hypothetical protein